MKNCFLRLSIICHRSSIYGRCDKTDFGHSDSSLFKVITAHRETKRPVCKILVDFKKNLSRKSYASNFKPTYGLMDLWTYGLKIFCVNSSSVQVQTSNYTLESLEGYISFIYKSLFINVCLEFPDSGNYVEIALSIAFINE